MGITKPISTGISTFVNLGAALRALGYAGGTRITGILFDNPSAATPIYIHFTNSNLSAGLTGTDGIPLSSAAFPARRSLELLGGQSGDIPDLNHIWIFATANVPLTVAVWGS